jgi:hypothetical protein
MTTPIDLTRLVAPLVWERGVVDYAKPFPGMKYVACSTTPHGCWAWWLDGDSSTRTVERDEHHAKAAAQADFIARITAWLDPAALAAMLAEAVKAEREACARVLDARMEEIVKDEGSWEPDTNVTNLPEWAETACEELEAAAAAIRARGVTE